jgi:hypothetical protein
MIFYLYFLQNCNFNFFIIIIIIIVIIIWKDDLGGGHKSWGQK